jgi:hypothetical protein
VGHSSIAAMAQCMGLPLLRRRITGTSKHVGLEYAATAGDEVEDLRALLAAAQRLYAVEAVSTGAIASDYQRLRVESVCASLGLVSLGFLWRVSQRVRSRHRRRVTCGWVGGCVRSGSDSFGTAPLAKRWMRTRCVQAGCVVITIAQRRSR